MKRKVILYRGEDGYVVAEVPSLQGVISQGKTREEVLRNIKEAVSLHIEVLMERGLPIPQDETENGGNCGMSKLPSISGKNV